MSLSNFSLIPLQTDQIPPPGPEFESFKAKIIASAAELLESLPRLSNLRQKDFNSDWEKRKTFNKNSYPTYSYSSKNRRTEDYKFHTRISRHPGAGEGKEFKKFKFLLEDHSLNEQKYIATCSEAKLIERLDEGAEIWRMSYDLPPPTSNREFLILILTIPSDSNAFQVISIPIEHKDAPLRKNYVRGRYVSIEDVREVDEEIIWTMAVASSAGGRVPKAITELVMCSKIAEDVPSYLDWVNKQ